MADTVTTNYEFIKPEVGGSNNSWGGKLNGNWDDVDTILKALSDGAGDVFGPASAVSGQVVVFDGVSGKIIRDSGIPASDVVTGASTHAAADKATPVDADELPLVDSAASWSLKKLTWANIKAALSTVFLPLAGGTMTGLLTLAPSDDDPDGTASLNIPAGADVPDVQADGDIWADSNKNLCYRRGGEDAKFYDSVNLPRPEPGEMAAGIETEPLALSAADVSDGVRGNIASATAWVNFNGTGTLAIRDSYNVSSITDNGTGDYSVNFTSALANADYAVAMSTEGSSSPETMGTAVVSRSTTVLRVKSGYAYTTGKVDMANFSVIVFGG